MCDDSGNGTQDAFIDDENVLFISTHQEGSFPCTGVATTTGATNSQRGAGGSSTNVNVNLPADAGHDCALMAFDEIVGPAMERFAPEMVFVSAGYDAHWRDPLAGLQVRALTVGGFRPTPNKCRCVFLFLCASEGVILHANGKGLSSTTDDGNSDRRV